jgi:hypothetical protein
LRPLAVFAAALAVSAAVLVTAGTASAVASSVPGYGRAPNGLTFSAEGTLAYNQEITVDCWSNGSNVNGDTYWDSYHTSSGAIRWVSDYWLYTGGTITGQVPSCEAAHDNETPGIAEKSGGLPYYYDFQYGYDAGTGPQEGTLADGAYVWVTCYATDSSGNLWDDVVVSTSGGVISSAYVSDAWLYTGGNITGQTKNVCPQP